MITLCVARWFGLASAVTVGCFGSGLSVLAADIDIDAALVTVENSAMARLAAVVQSPQNRLLPFATDGCSGGLSTGWRVLGNAIPMFRDKFGARPPYESCCVEHDRSYWLGSTDNGYQKRHAADQALRACVIEHGRVHRDDYAREFGISGAAIERNFFVIAEAMYRAVRAGGGPCTALPWRWGYGWPTCVDAD